TTSFARRFCSSAASVSSTSRELSSTSRMRLSSVNPFLRFARQREEKCCSPVDLSLGPGLAPVATDDAAHVGEADPRPFELVCGVEALEHSEELPYVFHVIADAIVAYAKYVLTVQLGARDLDDRALARSRVLDRVRQQIPPYQSQHRRVAGHLAKLPDAPFDRARGDLRLQLAQHFLDHRVHRHALPGELGTSHPREREQVVDECAGLLRGIGDDVEIVRSGGVERAGAALAE